MLSPFKEVAGDFPEVGLEIALGDPPKKTLASAVYDII
jgi:hypothetical protein